MSLINEKYSLQDVRRVLLRSEICRQIWYQKIWSSDYEPVLIIFLAVQTEPMDSSIGQVALSLTHWPLFYFEHIIECQKVTQENVFNNCWFFFCWNKLQFWQFWIMLNFFLQILHFLTAFTIFDNFLQMLTIFTNNLFVNFCQFLTMTILTCFDNF